MSHRTLKAGGWLCGSLLLLAFVATPLSGWAQATPQATPGSEPPTFLLEPVEQEGSYLTFEIAAGEQQETGVIIGIGGDTPVQTRTYAADVFTLTNGGFGVQNEDEPVSGATTWLDYSTESLELKPEQVSERTFTISVPEGTPPGQYITAIVVQTADSLAIGGSDMLRQTLRKAIAVLISVPGETTPELSIGEASLHRTINVNNLIVEIANTGTVLLRPSGSLTVTDASGREIVNAPVTMGTIYAGTETTLHLAIPAVLAPGTYDVSVSLTDSATGATASANPQLIVTDLVDQATPQAAPVTIDRIAVDPVTDANGDIQMVNVVVDIQNISSPLPAARITLNVTRDGELVENYLLSPSLAVPGGVTTVQQRYIPIEGWQSGTYAFSVTLEAIDLATGQSTLLGEQDAPETVMVE